MTPKELAHRLVDEFETFNSPGVWTFLRHSVVLNQMRDRIDDPNLVNQGGVGLCGPAAFLRNLLIDDPVLYALVGRDLYQRAAAHLTRGHDNHGGVFLQPDKDLLGYQIPTDAVSKDLVIPQADWMILASIRQSCRHWFWQHHFYQAKGDEGGTSADQMIDIFKDMGYSKVVNATGRNNAHKWFAAYAAGTYVNAGYHVTMMIDANLLVPLMQYVSNEIPLHWVDLATPIGGTAAALSFKIWTWGYKQLVSIPVPGGGPNLPTDSLGNLSSDAFLKYFYGFVAAKY